MRLLLTFTAIILLHSFSVQSQSSEGLNEAKGFIVALQGTFTWRMMKPSVNQVTRTGTMQAHIRADTLALHITEQFDDSNVEMAGMFGYNISLDRFFNINVYNVDQGPHIIYGHTISPAEILFDSDKTRMSLLTVVSYDVHQWTYKDRVNGEWKEADLKIVFTRVEE